MNSDDWMEQPRVREDHDGVYQDWLDREQRLEDALTWGLGFLAVLGAWKVLELAWWLLTWLF